MAITFGLHLAKLGSMLWKAAKTVQTVTKGARAAATIAKTANSAVKAAKTAANIAKTAKTPASLAKASKALNTAGRTVKKVALKASKMKGVRPAAQSTLKTIAREVGHEIHSQTAGAANKFMKGGNYGAMKKKSTAKVPDGWYAPTSGPAYALRLPETKRKVVVPKNKL